MPRKNFASEAEREAQRARDRERNRRYREKTRGRPRYPAVQHAHMVLSEWTVDRNGVRSRELRGV